MSAVLIASDHGGYQLKSLIIREASRFGISFDDLGTDSLASVDYPLYAKRLAEKLQGLLTKEPEARGILICGSGIGVSMAANRFRHVRAALCYDLPSAELARRHNNANVLCLGGRLIPWGLALDIVSVFLTTHFDNGRHTNRIKLFE